LLSRGGQCAVQAGHLIGRQVVTAVVYHEVYDGALRQVCWLVDHQLAIYD